jgi:hypothetical protein
MTSYPVRGPGRVPGPVAEVGRPGRGSGRCGYAARVDGAGGMTRGGGRTDLRPTLDPVSLAVLRYPAGWWPPTADGPFLAAVAEPGETTVVLPEAMLETLPAPDAVERGWQRITFPGPLPWDLVGFLADIAARLAAARIPFTSVSGFTTDHVLVRGVQADLALAVLRGEPGPDQRTDVSDP